MPRPPEVVDSTQQEDSFSNEEELTYVSSDNEVELKRNRSSSVMDAENATESDAEDASPTNRPNIYEDHVESIAPEEEAVSPYTERSPSLMDEQGSSSPSTSSSTETSDDEEFERPIVRRIANSDDDEL